jgi:hypothetical protein
MTGKVVLPPPSPEVRDHWLDLAITDLADPSLMTCLVSRLRRSIQVPEGLPCFHDRFPNDADDFHQRGRRTCWLILPPTPITPAFLGSRMSAYIAVPSRTTQRTPAQ